MHAHCAPAGACSVPKPWLQGEEPRDCDLSDTWPNTRGSSRIAAFWQRKARLNRIFKDVDHEGKAMENAMINMRKKHETHNVGCQQWREEAGSVLVSWILLSESGAP